MTELHDLDLEPLAAGKHRQKPAPAPVKPAPVKPEPIPVPPTPVPAFYGLVPARQTMELIELDLETIAAGKMRRKAAALDATRDAYDRLGRAADDAGAAARGVKEIADRLGKLLG